MFTVKWCSQCQVMKPMVMKIPNIEIIDIEENPEYPVKYNLLSLPTFIVDTGEEVKMLSGLQDIKSLQEFYG